MRAQLGQARLRARAAGAVLAAVAATAAVAGCGGGSPDPAGTSGAAAATAGQQVTIMGSSALRFTPMTIHVRTGTVRITLRDSGAYPHNIVIPALHVTSATVTGDPGGARTSFTVTFTRPGRYPFHCQYHASAGMAGTFLVS